MTVRICIDCEPDRTRKASAHIIRSMSDHYDNIFNARSAQIAHTRFDYCLVTKWKKRFESAHPARAARGENDGRDVIHLECAGKRGATALWIAWAVDLSQINRKRRRRFALPAHSK